jgi:hypothetical protein
MDPGPAPDRQCRGTTRADQRCRKTAILGSTYCECHGQDEHRCTATITGGTTRTQHAGERCLNTAVEGGTVCEYHGAGAPQVAAAAERRAAAERGLKLVRTYGKKKIIDPSAALLNEVHWTAGHVEWLRKRVQEIEIGELVPKPGPGAAGGATGSPPAGANALVWGTTRRKVGGHDQGVTEEAGVNAILALYQAERTHLTKVCDIALRAGVEERRVRIAERDGELVARCIRAILDDLDLNGRQRALISTVVPRHLRALAGGDVEDAEIVLDAAEAS